jgi:hypothetical protein
LKETQEKEVKSSVIYLKWGKMFERSIPLLLASLQFPNFSFLMPKHKELFYVGLP